MSYRDHIFDEYNSWDSEDFGNGFVAGGASFKPKTCKRCGAYGFHWRNHLGRWRLFDVEHNLHECKPRSKASKSDPAPKVSP